MKVFKDCPDDLFDPDRWKIKKSMSISTRRELNDSVMDHLKVLKNYSSDINYFFSRLETTSNRGVGIFGGAVRDWHLGKIPKDIDIVIDTDYFKEALEGVHAVTDNIFGGTVVVLDGVSFDIWNLSDTYAFKSGQFSASWENLVYSVPFNIDGIIALTDGRVYDHPSFWDGLTKLEIEFINPEHKDPKFIAQRALLFAAKYEFALGPKIADHIKKYLKTDEISEVKSSPASYLKTSNPSF